MVLTSLLKLPKEILSHKTKSILQSSIGKRFESDNSKKELAEQDGLRERPSPINLCQYTTYMTRKITIQTHELMKRNLETTTIRDLKEPSPQEMEHG